MKTGRILQIMLVVAWVVYAGAILHSVFVVGIFLGSYNLPENLTPYNFVPVNLSALRASHPVPFVLLMSLSIAIAVLHVQLWEKVKNILEKININSPFTTETARRMTNLGYLLLCIWIVSFIGDSYVHYLSKHIGDITKLFDSTGRIGFKADGVYLLNAGIVYIIAQIFRRGVELQQENELTI